MDVAQRRSELKLGIWVEPEMVNAQSELYDNHSDWILACRILPSNGTTQPARSRPRQDRGAGFIIKAISDLLSSAHISYVKWDNNRGMHEVPGSDAPHAYMLGLYRVLDTDDALPLRALGRLPRQVAAASTGNFLYYYWCQSWTPTIRTRIRAACDPFAHRSFYPPSAMGCHVSACPNDQSANDAIKFRAHVALMGGCFGFEIDLGELTEEERSAVRLSSIPPSGVNPFITKGDLYRLAQARREQLACGHVPAR